MKNGPKIVKNVNFQKHFFFCSKYVTLSLHVKNSSCRSNEVACGQYKDKEGKTIKNWKMTQKMSILQNFEKCFGISFHFVLRTYHTKKYDSTTKNVDRVLSPTSAYYNSEPVYRWRCHIAMNHFKTINFLSYPSLKKCKQEVFSISIIFSLPGY